VPSPFTLHVAEVMRRAGNERDVVITEPIESLIVDDPRFPAEARITATLHLESLTDGLVVRGEVVVPWSQTCRRCLQPAEGNTVSMVDELYQQVLTDPDAFELHGDTLDLAPMVRDLVLLDTPDGPLCRPECAGLCPQCGVNRNDTPCECTTDVVDDRWAGLDQLKGVLRDLSSDDGSTRSV
jgi:uncharacterized protein